LKKMSKTMLARMVLYSIRVYQQVAVSSLLFRRRSASMLAGMRMVFEPVRPEIMQPPQTCKRAPFLN
jgi:hypothetical protein